MNLIHSVLIQAATTTYDTEAMPVRAWTTLKTMIADVQPKALTANEIQGFGISNLQADAKIMYFIKDTSIAQGMRVIYDSNIFEIRGVNSWRVHSSALLIPVQGEEYRPYTIIYNRNGATSGSVPVDAKLYKTGEGAVILGNTGTLARTGYTFTNWNTTITGTGTTYAPAATLAISGNVILYAKWTVIP